MHVHQEIWATTFQPRGFKIIYRFGITNYCPGCGGTQWHVGRSSAQCAFCATAVLFAAQPETHAA
jgi:hypothetical protein